MVQLMKQNQDAGGFRFGQVKRKFRRINIPGFVSDLADGNSIVTGVVENISTGGVKVTGVPKSFTAKKHTYTVILSGGGEHYRMLVTPCWRKQGQEEKYVEIGFKILDAPWEWLALTMDEIPDFETYDEFGFQA